MSRWEPLQGGQKSLQYKSPDLAAQVSSADAEKRDVQEVQFDEAPAGPCQQLCHELLDGNL